MKLIWALIVVVLVCVAALPAKANGWDAVEACQHEERQLAVIINYLDYLEVGNGNAKHIADVKEHLVATRKRYIECFEAHLVPLKK